MTQSFPYGLWRGFSNSETLKLAGECLCHSSYLTPTWQRSGLLWMTVGAAIEIECWDGPEGCDICIWQALCCLHCLCTLLKQGSS